MPDQTTKIDQGLKTSILRGIAQSTSIAVSSGILGLAYGASAKSVGISWVESVLASALIFTGAAQFAVLPLIEAAVAPTTIALVAALVSLRLFLMAGSIAASFKGLSRLAQIAAIPFVSDGSWAVAMSETDPRARFIAFVSAGMWIVFNWIVGTGTGHAFAGLLPINILEAVRLSGTVFLAILLIAVTRNVASARVAHWAIAGMTTAVASLVVPVSIAFVIGFGVGALLVVLSVFARRSRA